MKIIKKDLDELQKQILLGIESRGFWIAFWGSLILLIVQMIFTSLDKGTQPFVVCDG